MLKGPAMTRDQAGMAILSGYEEAKALFDSGVEILGTGDMGIGNTTPSAAIGAVISGAALEQMVGRLTMELEVAKKASNILTSLSNRNGRS